MIPYLYLIAGFILLLAGGEFLVRSAVGLSIKLNLSKMVIGLTVVSFATSAPELIVSVQAAINGYPGLALGNVVGSNIANIALILGLTTVITSLDIPKAFLRFNWAWMVFLSLLLYTFLRTNNNLMRWEGMVLLAGMAVFVFLLLKTARNNPEATPIETPTISAHWGKIILFLVLGGLALWLGSEWLVNGAVTIASQLGIPESIIAVSMVAVGTSVPELAASIIAAVKKESAISLGNLVGSNIFNIGFVLGITSMIKPIRLDAQTIGLLDNDMYWMLGIACSLLPLALLPKRYEITRWNGVFLVLIYVAFIFKAFSTL